MIDEFLAAVTAWGGVARRVPTTGAARTTVAELLTEFEAKTLSYWDGDPLVAAIDPAGMRAPAPPERAGAGRGRGVGLLPDIHITLLAADRIVADLQTALQLAYAGSSPPSAITVITGPSASSDIEKIRVTGVHGPRRMGVVVVG